MNTKLTLYIMVFILFFVGVSVLFPYPVFSDKVNLTANDLKEINDAHEEEEKPISPIIETKVVNLNWFDVVNNFFPLFTPVRVIDCLTKTEYYVQRGGGHNHADVEPIDANNAAKFKSLYNGTWSWARRAVWVELNGCFVAASINGMPHGFEFVTDNNMPGHSCIHFLLSRTHGTDRVDPDHQACVQYAIDHKNELISYILNKTKK